MWGTVEFLHFKFYKAGTPQNCSSTVGSLLHRLGRCSSSPKERMHCLELACVGKRLRTPDTFIGQHTFARTARGTQSSFHTLPTPHNKWGPHAAGGFDTPPHALQKKRELARERERRWGLPTPHSAEQSKDGHRESWGPQGPQTPSKQASKSIRPEAHVDVIVTQDPHSPQKVRRRRAGLMPVGLNSPFKPERRVHACMHACTFMVTRSPPPPTSPPGLRCRMPPFLWGGCGVPLSPLRGV